MSTHEDDLRAQMLTMFDAEPAEESANQPPPSWEPSPGDLLIGTLRGVRTVQTRYGDRQVAHVETDDGPIALWLSPAALRRLWAEHGPNDGDTIGVRYVGKKPTRDGSREYRDFELKVLRPDGSGWGDEPPY